MQTDFELLFTCMFIIGGGLYWMLRMPSSLFKDSDEHPLGAK